MSTYNGEKYVEEQIKSIMKQTVPVDLLVRDDGSTDSTLVKLEDLQKKYPQINIVKGENIGWRSSFFELLKISGEYDYYAFADQDDIWYEDKVEKALMTLEKMDEKFPNLFLCSAMWVDDKLERIDQQSIICKPKTSYEAVLNSWGLGAEMFFNKTTRDMARYHVPQYPCAHDVWVYDIAFFLGEIVVSKEKLMMYRRHQESVTTVKNNSLYQRIQAYKKIGRFGNYAYDLVKAFAVELQNKDKKSYNELKVLADYKQNVKHKISLLINPQIRKQTILGTINLKLQILFSIF